MNPDKCAQWNHEDSRQCRNKRQPDSRLCKKHTILWLEKFEGENRDLIVYLKFRHLLKDHSNEG